MTSDKNKAQSPKERLSQTVSKATESKKVRSHDFKDEEWYNSAFARFSVSKASRGEGLNRLLPPKKFG